MVGLVLAGCKGPDDPDPEQQIALGQLSKTWTISSAKLDGTTRTDFSTIALTISGTFNNNTPDGPYNYIVSGTRPNQSPWPASGTWTFGSIDGLAGVINRDTGTNAVLMTYTLSSDAKTLTLTFTITGAGFAGSRTNAVSGNWEFVFTGN